MKIGVLAVQGAFIEHEHIIEKIGHEIVEIRQKKDLDGIDGIILPGGESTVQGHISSKLFCRIRRMLGRTQADTLTMTTVYILELCLSL